MRVNTITSRDLSQTTRGTTIDQIAGTKLSQRIKEKPSQISTGNISTQLFPGTATSSESTSTKKNK